jgi:hypothetical protein
VLFHLSNKDIFLALDKFINSDCKYILTTTHLPNKNWENCDISSGSFRLIDLFQIPYSFPNSVLYRFNDYIDPHPPREMCLFSKNDIKQVIKNYS